MNNLIDELKQAISFKDTTDIGDIVLIASKDPQILIYGLITSIERDESRKDEWWVIDISLLAIPPQKVQWTLRTAQMTGMEIFTMGGEERFFKAVDFEKQEAMPQVLKEQERQKEKKDFIKRIK